MAGSAEATKQSPSTSFDWSGLVFTLIAVIAALVILQWPELSSGWQQRYDPTGRWWLSTIIASLPVIVLLGALAFGHTKAHYAALAGLVAALLTAIIGFHMPARMAAATAVYGALYGLFPIGWIVLNVIFLYQLTVEAGRFEVLKHSLTGITQDRRLQLLLIAFSFGAFFEGAAGFGTPVAVTAALLIGLGFRPLSPVPPRNGTGTRAIFRAMCSSTALRWLAWWECWLCSKGTDVLNADCTSQSQSSLSRRPRQLRTSLRHLIPQTMGTNHA